MTNHRGWLPLAACVFVCGCADPFEVGEDADALTGVKGVDYAWARPSPSGLKSAGYSFVVRYLAPDTSGKILLKPEADALIKAKLDIVVVFEQGAQNAMGGHSQGVTDAKLANTQAAAAGMPSTRPIYFAVDFDATSSQRPTVGAYFDGVASVIGRNRTGAYGGYSVIKYLFDNKKIDWGWQCYAWSYGSWDSRAQFRQVQNDITAGGSSNCCDLDQAAVADFGQWGQAADWAAKVASQSWPATTTAMTIHCGEAVPASITLKNVGSKTWNASTKLGTTVKRDRASIFAGSDWAGPNRPDAVTGTVAPGASYTFKFAFHGPTGTACVPGTYTEHFGVLQEGVAWFSDAGQGGPADDLIAAHIKLVAAPPQQKTDTGTAHQTDGRSAGSADGGLAGSSEEAGPARPASAAPHGSGGGCSIGPDTGASILGFGLGTLLVLAGFAVLAGALRRRRPA